MRSEELVGRTKRNAIAIVRLVETLQKGMVTDVLTRQLIRSSCSVAANYRAACRARSKADFTKKIGLVEEEADETIFWLEMLVESGRIGIRELGSIIEESRQLAAIFAASHKTARLNR